jgi:thiol:disulfide interchange protein
MLRLRLTRAAFLLLSCIAALTAVVLSYGAGDALAQARRIKAIDWNERQIKWQSFEAGLQEAEQTRTPILILFYTDWCPHCMAHSRLFRDP